MKRRLLQITVVLLVMLPLAFACQSHEDEHHAHHGVMDRIQHESQQQDENNLPENATAKAMATVPIIDSEYNFHIPERKNAITSFPCSNCHTEPIDKLKAQDSTKNAHWNIKLHHANLATMNCNTCHAEKDVDQLHSLTGKSISFDHSYQLCGQCHSEQFKDWKGGAHGKRVGGWAPPRVSKTCVNCHNPHQPAFEERWPARLNTQKIKERKGN